MIIGIQNLSTLVSSQDVYDMTLLIDRQLRDHVAPAWGLLPPEVTFLAVAPGRRLDAIISILDNADQAGDLGYHAEGPDADVYGRVFAQPVLANGGNPLTDPLSVCSVLSHEAIETFLDPACDLWAQQADGTLVARELCDPVESDSYVLAVTASSGESAAGTVSDFVLPSWFDPGAAAGPADYLGLATAPFQVRSTGYVIVMSAGSVTEQWGEHYPEWKKATKQSPLARTAQRLKLAVPVVLTSPVLDPTSLA